MIKCIHCGAGLRGGITPYDNTQTNLDFSGEYTNDGLPKHLISASNEGFHCPKCAEGGPFAYVLFNGKELYHYTNESWIKVRLEGQTIRKVEPTKIIGGRFR